ncbi:hypothetical protein Scep_029349 [Stephania cephalantha]|uniref:Uncharacterized protein n=1 Tax=Stephania cephalantha TaxID=152367 RepID=A0AAP0E0T7_9MAGN
MDDTFLDSTEETKQDDDSQLSLQKEIGSGEGSLIMKHKKIKRWERQIKEEQTAASESRQEHISERCINKASPRKQIGMNITVPKHARVISLDEKFLHQYLGFLPFKGSDPLAVVCGQAASCSIAVNMKSSQMRILLENLNSHKNGRKISERGSILIQCPSAGGVVERFPSPNEGNENIRSIVKVPLPYHLGVLDDDMRMGGAGKIDVKGTGSNFGTSPSGFSFSSSQTSEKEKTHGHAYRGLKSLHMRNTSFLSVSSSFSDQSILSASETIYQGMLHCQWKGGIPYFDFSVDNHREVYVANPLRIDSPYNKNVDYLYLFHSKTSSQGSRGTCKNGDLVAKMTVSSSLSLSSDSSKVVETEFVTSAADKKYFRNVLNSGGTSRNSKGSPMKLVDVLRKKKMLQHRSDARTKFGDQRSILEDVSDPIQDSSNKFISHDSVDRTGLLESAPNLELSAVVVKDQFHCNNQDKTIGGWGLRFLEKTLASSADTSLETCTSFDDSLDSYRRSSSDCSTSMTVLLPAGIHGGPETRNGGPSGLLERWRSGGQCECGGWDVGCPLTILSDKAAKEEALQADSAEECKSFDLFREGEKQGVPFLKMVNIHDGLYIVHFQSTLSPLQSFSIAVAKIHAQSPAFSLQNSKKSSTL